MSSSQEAHNRFNLSCVTKSHKMSRLFEPTTQQIPDIKSLNSLLRYMTRLEHLTFLMAAGIIPTSPMFVMRWGHLLGCVVQLLRKNGVNYYWTESVSGMTIDKVQWIIRSNTINNYLCIINIGFSIGFLQEYFEETEKKWWEPVIRYLKSDNNDLEKIRISTLEKLPPLVQSTHLFCMGSVLNGVDAIDWLRIGKEIFLEHDKIKRIFWRESQNRDNVKFDNEYYKDNQPRFVSKL